LVVYAKTTGLTEVPASSISPSDITITRDFPSEGPGSAIARTTLQQTPNIPAVITQYCRYLLMVHLGDARTESLEQFVEATQIAQGTIFQWGIEHMRRRKPKSSAISICHFITRAPDMKWGIVDYYEKPKLSYDYVKRAYQPLLVSLEIDKRRRLPGEMLESTVWIVNDLHKSFTNCTLTIEICDASGHSLLDKTTSLSKIEADSSAAFETIRWEVRGKIGDTFRLDATVRDPDGRTISTNLHILLLGDQDQARRDGQKRADHMRQIRGQFPTADYYRFFPEFSGYDWTEWQQSN
jgi:beta-mannosidase